MTELNPARELIERLVLWARHHRVVGNIALGGPSQAQFDLGAAAAFEQAAREVLKLERDYFVNSPRPPTTEEPVKP